MLSGVFKGFKNVSIKRNLMLLPTLNISFPAGQKGIFEDGRALNFKTLTVY